MKVFLVKIYVSLINFKDNKLPFYFTKTPFLASLYYLIFSTKFRRENHAVINGKVEHLKKLKKEKNNIYTLIRNTHRLEKGLLMRPRKGVYALNYIEETVDSFIHIWKPSKMKEDEQYKWFYDVLSEYFETSSENQLIEALFNKFKTFIKTSTDDELVVSNNSTKKIPYKRILEMKPNISYEDFYNLNRYRRSVRWFLNKKVPRGDVDLAIRAANQSPSACNRQPYHYKVIDEPALLKKVSSLPGGVRGYEKGIPMMIVVVGNLDAYFDERDRHIIYIDASLANMTLMLALETLNLSSCSINWPDVEHLEKQMQKTLNLKPNQRPVMCIAIGYPDPEGKVAFSEKRDLNYIRSYN